LDKAGVLNIVGAPGKKDATSHFAFVPPKN
jgi:hypothetical protein